MQDKFRLGKYWLDTVPGSSRLYAFWYDTGTREVSRRSLKTGDVEEAKIRLAKIVATEGEAKPRDPGEVMLAAVLTRYFVEHTDRKPNPTAARRAGTLLMDFMGSTAKVGEITKTRQRDFIKHLHGMGLGVGTIGRMQSSISAALRYATADDDDDEKAMLVRAPKVIMSPAIIAEILNVPEPQPQNWHPTLEQIAAFMDHATTTEVLRCALLTVAFAGRPEAVREFNPEQFDARYGLLAFNAPGRRQTKKHRPTVPVPPRLLEHIGTFGPIGFVRWDWYRTRDAVGLPKEFRQKSLRHFMATEMRKRGVPREQREEWMGHRRRSTNDRYGVFAPDYLNTARDCANAVLGELETACKLSIYRQVAAKSALERFDPIGQSALVTGVIRLGGKPKVA